MEILEITEVELAAEIKENIKKLSLISVFSAAKNLPVRCSAFDVIMTIVLSNEIRSTLWIRIWSFFPIIGGMHESELSFPQV